MGGPERPGKHLHGGDAMRIDSGINTGFPGGLQNGISAALALQSSSRLERAAIASRPVGSFAGTRPTVGSASTIGGSSSALGDLGRQLAELRTLIERGDGKGSGLGLDLGEIERLARAVDQALGDSPLVSDGPFDVQLVDPVVADFNIERLPLNGDEFLDIDVHVVEPGERAALYMDFGETLVSAKPGAPTNRGPFEFQLFTRDRGFAFAFSSGTSLATVADTVTQSLRQSSDNQENDFNAAFAEVDPSGTGIRFGTYNVGEQASLRMRVVSGGEWLDGRGVAPLRGFEGAQPSDDGFISAEALQDNGAEVVDSGRNIKATINGEPAFSFGQKIFVTSSQMRLDITLRRIEQVPGSRFAANFTGLDTAFSVRRLPGGELAGPPSVALGAAIAQGDAGGAFAEIDRLLDALGYDARRPGLAFDGRG